MKRYLLGLVSIALVMGVPLTGYAAIIDTSVTAFAKITSLDGDHHEQVVVEETVTGVTAAYASALDSVTSAQVTADLFLDSLSDETANLNFDISFLGYGPDWYGLYSREKTGTTIKYDAIVDSTLDISWDFSYTGPMSFGLQSISLRKDYSWDLFMGNSGSGDHVGTTSFDLIAGESYRFDINFWSLIGAVVPVDGLLSGNIFLDFQGGSNTGDPVPEPATILLFGTALVGLAGSRLRKKKK